jgi:hypothetical protein
MNLTGYLAGPAAEVERSIEAARVLRDSGCELTMPWWNRVLEERRHGWMSDKEVPADFMRTNASLNRAGIERSEFLVALCRSVGGVSAGTAGEVGYGCALFHLREALGKIVPNLNRYGMRKVIIVGDPTGFVWSYDSGISVVKTIDDAIDILAAL